MCRPINIFLGSSIVELKNERRNFSSRISEDIEHLLKNDNINIHFVKCESNHAGNDGSRDQDYYNQLLSECDYSVFLFKTHLGSRTEEEYNIARNLQKSKKHVIFVYFIDVPENMKEQRLIRFQNELEPDWELCESIEDVQYRFTLGLLKRLGIRVVETKSREDKLSQFLELRQDLHSEIDNMLAEIEKIKTTPSDSVVAMIMNVIGIYRQADKWAASTDYDKNKYCELLFNYADFLDKYGLYYDSIEIYIRHIKYAEDVYGMEHRRIATSNNNLGEIYRETGNYSLARDYFSKALRIVEKNDGLNHPVVARIYNNIGLSFYEQGDCNEARKYYKLAIDIHIKVNGTNNPLYAKYCNNIGSSYWKQKEYSKALDYYFEALEIQEKVLGEHDPDIAYTYNSIGSVMDEEGNYEEALKYYKKALEIRENVLGKGHPSTATTYHNIGFSYYKMKKYDIALEYMHKALAVFQEKLGPMHPSTITVQKCIANVETSMRKSMCQSSKEE